MTTKSGLSRRDFLSRGSSLGLGVAIATQAPWVVEAAYASSHANWAALGDRLHGELVQPGDLRYRIVAPPYNKRYANIHPRGIALCRGADDVQACVNWARENGVHFVPRSGGHSYGGYSVVPGLVIDLKKMASIHVDTAEGVGWISAGALNRDIYAGLRPYNLAVPSGRCPTVGIGGYLLGGGFGFNSRHLGLACDNLIETHVVTASGSLLTCNEQQHPDLFWALRGGGGGNFGINLRYKLKLHHVDQVAVYSLSWRWADSARALSALQEVVSTAPSTFSLRMGMDVAGKGVARGGPKPTVSALGQLFGSEEELRALLRPVFTSVPPEAHVIRSVTFYGAEEYLKHNVPTGRFMEKSSYVREPIPATAFERLATLVERWPGSSNPSGGGVALFAWGGLMNSPPRSATAFVHRDATLLVAYGTSWSSRDAPRLVRSNLDWLQHAHHEMRPHISGEAYQNFIDPSLMDWQRAYYAENLERLSHVKRRYDPGNVFRFPQSIPPG